VVVLEKVISWSLLLGPLVGQANPESLLRVRGRGTRFASATITPGRWQREYRGMITAKSDAFNMLVFYFKRLSNSREEMTSTVI
jgi:hypothetical protein